MVELRLKNYQQLAIDALRDYFKACVRTDNAEEAFVEVLRDDDAPLVAPHYISESRSCESSGLFCNHRWTQMDTDQEGMLLWAGGTLGVRWMVGWCAVVI